MSRDKDGNLVIKVDLTNTDIFNEFKNITYRMLKDERIDCLVRDEYWNEVMTWLADSLDNKIECSCTECSCKEKFKITCQTCGSNDVSILEDYDCDDHSYVYGYYLECNVCKENNL